MSISTPVGISIQHVIVQSISCTRGVGGRQSVALPRSATGLGYVIRSRRAVELRPDTRTRVAPGRVDLSSAFKSLGTSPPFRFYSTAPRGFGVSVSAVRTGGGSKKIKKQGVTKIFSSPGVGRRHWPVARLRNACAASPGGTWAARRYRRGEWARATDANVTPSIAHRRPPPTQSPVSPRVRRVSVRAPECVFPAYPNFRHHRRRQPAAAQTGHTPEDDGFRAVHGRRHRKSNAVTGDGGAGGARNPR